MANRSTHLMAAIALLLPATALANPVLYETLEVRQVPNSMHVQVTFITPDGLVDSATRDGSPLEGVWAATAGYAKNMGSGVVSTPGYQFCDCALTVGTHVYELEPVGEQSSSLWAQVEVFEGFSGASAPETGGAGGMMPWEEPDPVEMQGLDCMVECAGIGAGGAGAGGAGGASSGGASSGGTATGSSSGGTATGSSSGGVTVTGGTSSGGLGATEGSKPKTSDDGGCSIGTRHASAHLGWLACGGLALLFVRRRR